MGRCVVVWGEAGRREGGKGAGRGRPQPQRNETRAAGVELSECGAVEHVVHERYDHGEAGGHGSGVTVQVRANELELKACLSTRWRANNTANVNDYYLMEPAKTFEQPLRGKTFDHLVWCCTWQCESKAVRSHQQLQPFSDSTQNATMVDRT